MLGHCFVLFLPSCGVFLCWVIVLYCFSHRVEYFCVGSLFCIVSPIVIVWSIFVLGHCFVLFLPSCGVFLCWVIVLYCFSHRVDYFCVGLLFCIVSPIAWSIFVLGYCFVLFLPSCGVFLCWVIFCTVFLGTLSS